MNKLLITLVGVFLTFSTFSQNIAQWRGDSRDGIYLEDNLLKEWPVNGPELLWHFNQLGDGHASAAVTDELVYTAGTADGNGFVIALDYNGNVKWKKEYGREWVESYDGVRSTPLVVDDKLYILSGYGLMLCMDSQKGDVLWQVDLMKQYDGRNIRYGFTENLAFDGEKIFCTPGGVDANVIALNRHTGELIWKSQGNGEKSAYCSPLIIDFQNRNILVTMTEKSILGFDVKTGEMLWSHPHKNRWSVHANSPLYHDGRLYCLSGYGKGGVMLKISEDGTQIEELWSDSLLDSKMGGVVLLDGRIYGSGDVNRSWYCLDWETGKELYSSKMIGRGNVIYSDEMLYCYAESGHIGLVEPKSDSFNLVSSFKVPFGTKQHWAHLVIHNKRLYVRHGSSLMVYSLSYN